MREIKFRAWVRNYMVQVISIDFENKYITWDDNQYDRCDPPNKCYEMESFEDIKLMQYTGLKDVNNKEIYEGDIIKRATGYTFAVMIRAYRLGEIHQSMAYGYDVMDSDEIIGNIYEHKNII